MVEFFRGWRRKVGVVTLVMALGGMALWCRSQVVADIISDDTVDFCEFKTGGGQIQWTRHHSKITYKTGDGGFLCGGVREGRRWETTPYRQVDFQTGANFRYTARLELPGFDFSEATHEQQFDSLTFVTIVKLWSISLLWFVIPTTMLSGYLLLSQTRKPIPMNIHERIPG